MGGGAHDAHDATEGWDPHGVVARGRPRSARGSGTGAPRRQWRGRRTRALSGEGERSAREGERWRTARDILMVACGARVKKEV